MAVAFTYLKKRWYNVVFNVGAFILSVGGAGFVYHSRVSVYGSNGLLLSWTSIAYLSLAALTYFMVNTGLVATVVALREKRAAWHTWVLTIERVAPEYFTLILLGILTSIVYNYAWWALVLLLFPVIIVYHSLQTSQELRTQTVAAIEALADTLDRRDPYTFQHSQRVAQYAEKIAAQLKLPPEEIDLIRMSARVHDLGKMGITNEMLYKPGSLTPEEEQAFRQHVAISADIVQRFPQYKKGSQLILYHHERYDGQGYPQGLNGEQIPMGARIIAVADAYDAMTTDRPYRRARRREEAIEELRRCAGTQFDPKVVEAFLGIEHRA